MCSHSTLEAMPRLSPSRGLEQRQHVADRAIEPDESGAGDDVVPDIEFDDLFDPGYRPDVAIGKPVAGQNLKVAGNTEFRSAANSRQFLDAGGKRPVRQSGVRVP